MITLYVKTGCPFCLAVLGKVDDLGLEVEQKNIAEDENLTELMDKGGKRMVPFMIDTDQDVSMYESGDIIEHLNKHYPKSEEVKEETV